MPKAPAPAAPDDAPALTVEGPITVVAMRPGTYPRPGDTYGIYRDTGSVFVLNSPAHFADHKDGGWMKLWKQGDPIPTESAPTVPQTAQRGTMNAQTIPLANPFAR